MGMHLAYEFAAGLLAALVACLVLGSCAPGRGVLCQALATMGMGLFGWLSISASHWTWYGFSDGFFVSEGIQQALGWLLAGLAMGALKRRGSGAP